MGTCVAQVFRDPGAAQRTQERRVIIDGRAPCDLGPGRPSFLQAGRHHGDRRWRQASPLGFSTHVDGAEYAVRDQEDWLIGVMECWSAGTDGSRMDDGGSRRKRKRESRMEDGRLREARDSAVKVPIIVIASITFVAFLVLSANAQEKVRFPIGESSKTLSYGPLWVASKMGFFEREGLEVPIVTMRGSPLTIQALTADSIYIANATVDTLI